MGKKNKVDQLVKVMWLFLGVFLIGTVYVATDGFGKSPFSSGTPGVSGGSGTIAVSSDNCPDTKVHVATINLRNALNVSAQETFDTNYILKNLDTGATLEGTDSTAGANNLVCPNRYSLQVKTADGASGDNSFVAGFDSQPGSNLNARVENGIVYFTATGQSATLDLKGTQHATLESRVKDNGNNAYVYGSAESATGTWVADGTSFYSTTSNATGTTYGTGAEIDLSVEVRTVQTDTHFADQGAWLFFDLATTVWKKPASVFWNGQALQEAKSTLRPQESMQFGTTYEYAYFIPSADFRDSTSKNTLDVIFDPLDTVNPGTSDDPAWALAAVGTYESTTSTNVLYTGAAQDDDSATVVYAVQNWDYQTV